MKSIMISAATVGVFVLGVVAGRHLEIETTLEPDTLELSKGTLPTLEHIVKIAHARALPPLAPLQVEYEHNALQVLTGLPGPFVDGDSGFAAMIPDGGLVRTVGDDTISIVLPTKPYFHLVWHDEADWNICIVSLEGDIEEHHHSMTSRDIRAFFWK